MSKDRFIFVVAIICSIFGIAAGVFLHSDGETVSPDKCSPSFFKFQQIMTKEGDQLPPGNPILVDVVIVNKTSIQSFNDYEFSLTTVSSEGNCDSKKFRVTEIHLVTGESILVRESMDTVDYVLKGLGDEVEFSKFIETVTE